MKIAPLEDRLSALAHPVLAEAGFALVALRVQSGVVQVFAEDPATRNLGIEDCATLHRALVPVLAAQGGLGTEWRLEVSSPGADRPLTKAQDFVDHAGREAKIELEAPDQTGQKKFRGVLDGIENDTVRIITEGQEVCIPLEAIAKARLVAQTEVNRKEPHHGTASNH